MTRTYRKTSRDISFILTIVLIVLIGMVGWYTYSHFEARAYKSVTGKYVSTWDAMFLDLRVVND